ncbi:F-box protein SKIP23-like [Tripterygium wilfordii]|uniref:F-box protein SKIP23-like n=1 Tax=Tripterygium wilfordii TaxID=458696 RepID=UPI0018F82BED|nr:F-box protein SKIP23-like [Tripterygium wilfordii]
MAPSRSGSITSLPMLLPSQTQPDQAMRDWAELPLDALQVILQKLIIGKDYYRFACACRSWSSVVVTYLSRYAPMDSPCLIVSGTTSQSRHLACAVGKDIAKDQDFLPQISVPLREICIGSYQGWVVMIDDDIDMYLLNPFSDTCIDLPQIDMLEINNLGSFIIHGISFNMDGKLARFNYCIGKVILSTIPTASDCFVLFIYGHKKLAFCKVGDEAWSYIDDGALRYDIDRNPKFYMDAIYFKGLFYVVSARGEIFACDLTVSEPTLTEIYGNGSLTSHALINSVLPPYTQLLWYLVECRGELFRILQAAKPQGKEEDHVNLAEPIVIEGEDGHKTLDNLYQGVSYGSFYFEIHKLDTRSGSKPSWVQVDTFEGDAVFLGRNQSFSLSNPLDFGYKGNRIYYTDHRSVNIEPGVFKLEDGIVEPLYKSNSSGLIVPPAIWVIPRSW